MYAASTPTSSAAGSSRCRSRAGLRVPARRGARGDHAANTRSSSSPTRTTRPAWRCRSRRSAAIAAAAPPEAMVFVDEAYAEFAGVTLIRRARRAPERDRRPHVLEGVRPGRPAHRVPGRRPGDGRADPPGGAAVYSVNIAAAVALPAALRRSRVSRRVLRAGRRSRRRCSTPRCDRLGLRYWKSAANFVLVRARRPTCERSSRALAARGIYVRDRSTRARLRRLHRASTTGVVEHTERVHRRAIEEVLCAAALIDRRTTETQIALRLALDGRGRYDVRTGIRFLDHMLELVARHGAFDLTIDADGRPRRRSASHRRGSRHRARRGGVDGARRRARHQPRRLLRDADGRDAGRRGHRSRRPAARGRRSADREVAKVGDLQTELVHDFFEGFAQGARANVHVKVLYGRSSHHRSRRSSRRSRARCAWPARKDERLARGCCRARKGLRMRVPSRSIDYGAGNLTSVRKGFAAVGADARTCRQRPRISPTRRGDRRARRRPFRRDAALGGEWREAILARVGRGVPLLGICLGMQWLFEGSDEAPDVPGLGAAIAAAGATRLPADDGRQGAARRLERARDRAAPSRSSTASPTGAQVYFTHSLRRAGHRRHASRATEHGEPFAAVVQRGQSAGVQFHPEKSGDVGLQILRNFVASIGALTCCPSASSPASTSATAGRQRRQLRRAAAGRRSRGARRAATTSKGSTSS